ncbi:MAG: metal-dependent hydrolase [Methanobrevibacter sp.]|jgi:inner membrane protein|nr:metal-dependent hydrolase [Methanobrevibacter sp.]
MASYKGHTLFAIILTLLYFTNPLYWVLTIVGANLPDFDHDVKKINLYKIAIVGLIVFITLYILKSSYLIGILILLVVIIFYFSKHRGFTHSIIGGFILTFLISGIMFFAVNLSNQIPLNLNINPPIVLLEIITIFPIILFLNKKISPIVIVLFIMGIIISPINIINYKLIASSIFLGVLSHTILDSFSPSKIELLQPFTSIKFGKSFTISMTFILILIAITYRLSLFI